MTSHCDLPFAVYTINGNLQLSNIVHTHQTSNSNPHSHCSNTQANTPYVHAGKGAFTFSFISTHSFSYLFLRAISCAIAELASTNYRKALSQNALSHTCAHIAHQMATHTKYEWLECTYVPALSRAQAPLTLELHSHTSSSGPCSVQWLQNTAAK